MDDNSPILQVAAKAILVNNEGKILIMREAGSSYAEGTNAGKYHCAAGGRINPSESFVEGLLREVEEETGIKNFEMLYPVHVGDWWPIIKGQKRHIIGVFIVCKTETIEVHLSEEHDDYRWISADEVNQYDILSSDGEAIKSYLHSLKKEKLNII